MEIGGRRVLVTGANRGLGQAVALACLEAGASEVLAGARDPDDLDNLKRLAPNGRLTPVRLDVTSDDDVQATAHLYPVDILINNAGICVYGSVLEVQVAALQNEMNVNYFGALRMARAVAPAMIARGDGLIVNVASILAKINLPALGNYCALKAALLSLSQALRGDLGRHGVRVITVLPGTIDTDMSRDFAGPKMSREQAAAEIIEAIRAERIETPIGDAAREVMAGLASDPLAMEMSFAEYRA
jgi:NAD(P)-dependent dehydrogenase (short-subunit alcohol dehydrogenase family)